MIADELSDLGAVYIRGDVPTIDNENSEDNYNSGYFQSFSDDEEKREKLVFIDSKMMIGAW